MEARELQRRVAERARRLGSLSFEEYVDQALYDPEGGFYSTAGRAGRRGDFLTSPEVGPLFGAVLARALDAWWSELDRPDPYVVVEAGAGVGSLAVAVLAARPACSSALRYVLVERSATLRAQHADHLRIEPPVWALGPAGHAGPLVTSLGELPSTRVTCVVLANELLDNLAFRLLERRRDGWAEVRVAADDDGALVEMLVAAPAELADVADELAPDAPAGGRLPLQRQAADWLTSALELLDRGRVAVIDYVDTSTSLTRRPVEEWLRTYRSHGRGSSPLEEPGAQDITCEVAADQLARVRPTRHDRSQAEFLQSHGIDDLVAAGRREWTERAHVADLAAVRGRSRVREAEALCDPGGLGSFRVLEWAL